MSEFFKLTFAAAVKEKPFAGLVEFTTRIAG